MCVYMMYVCVCLHICAGHTYTYTRLCSVHREQKRASDPLELTFLFLGFPQSSKGSRNGSPSDRETSDGHFDPSGASPHGGWTPDADALDQEDHCGGRPHGPTAGAHSSPHRAAL